MRNQFKKLEKNLTKDMSKTVERVNRKMIKNPIKLPVESGLPVDGITVKNIDNSIYVEGNIRNSQIGGSGNFQMNINEHDVVGILEEIKGFSSTLDIDDNKILMKVLNELQTTGKVESDSGKSFLEKHVLISIGVAAVISWLATSGLDSLSSLIQQVFS